MLPPSSCSPFHTPCAIHNILSWSPGQCSLLHGAPLPAHQPAESKGRDRRDHDVETPTLRPQHTCSGCSLFTILWQYRCSITVPAFQGQCWGTLAHLYPYRVTQTQSFWWNGCCMFMLPLHFYSSKKCMFVHSLSLCI